MLVLFKLLFGLFGVKAAQVVGTNPAAGLVVGLFFGHLIDTIAHQRFRRWRIQRLYRAEAERQFQERFIRSLFLMFAKLCAADGAIKKEEIAFVEKTMDELLKFDKKTKKVAVAVFRGARTSPLSFQRCAAEFFELYSNHPQMLETAVVLLLQLGTADGVLEADEERLIKAAATVFGFDESHYERLKRSYSTSSGTATTTIERSYSVLGCSPQDSNESIKKNYRKLVQEYHPDKIVAKELPEEFIRFANEKFKSIQEAYDCLKESRGIN
jgi:DnaJ like chaperone protein